MEEEEIFKDIKCIAHQIESIIMRRNQSLEICLWRTLESTLEILFIFTPKLIYNNGVSNEEHLITIVNASKLLSSVIRVILSKFKDDDSTVTETLISTNNFTNSVQKVKYLMKHQLHNVDHRLLLITKLHQVIKALLLTFSLEKNHRGSTYSMMTPPATPSNILSFQKLQEENDTLHEEVQEAYLLPQFDYYQRLKEQKQQHQYGQQQATKPRAKKSDKIKSNQSDTVGKRFIRSISSLKKNHQQLKQQQNIPNVNDQARQKIDEERKFIAEGDHNYLKKNSTKSSIRIFFGSKRQPSSISNKTNSHIRDIFESSNEVDSLNKRSSVQTLVSPFSRNITVRASEKTMLDSNCELEASDSGCFTTTPKAFTIEEYCTRHNNPMAMSIQQKSMASLQKEFAEPIFVKEQTLRQNRSESDLRSISNMLTPRGNNEAVVKRKPSQLSLAGKLYNINEHCDEDYDDILKCVKGKGKEGSILHISENGNDVLVMEMVQSSKLQVMAGTLERLFIKLADETCQDLDYVDTYILSHLFFTDSLELLENLMARFHLEALPGETSYFKKWQRCIQVKVLNVISRWIKLQFQDFRINPVLITRLEAFLNGDVTRAGFTIEADMIKEALDRQTVHFSRSRHSLIVQTSQSLVSFGNSSCSTLTTNSVPSVTRRPSVTPSFLSFVSYTTPPDSPTYSPDIFLSLNSKDVARYLTLADFYILKCITAQDFLAIYYPDCVNKEKKSNKIDYIAMMTERANRLSKWVVEEIVVHRVNSKQRKVAIRKMIEIAKLCLNWNNFHTCMVITMGLTLLQEFRDNSWQQVSLLPNKDILMLKQLLKYLNVCNNMSYYRQAFKKAAKAPCIPFFPIVLKDLTFLMDGNSTINTDGLVNFAKFRILVQSVHSVLNFTIENYYFASELEYFPFFPQQPSYSPPLQTNGNTLNQVAATLEAQIQNCCISDPCD